MKDQVHYIYGPIISFYGNLVILEHHWSGLEQPVYAVYAHLQTFLVKTGDVVSSGQKIGLVGSTGTASGSHLHFEVRTNGPKISDTVNPELWLQPAVIEVDKVKQVCGTLTARLIKGSDSIFSNAVLIQDFSDPSG